LNCHSRWSSLSPPNFRRRRRGTEKSAAAQDAEMKTKRCRKISAGLEDTAWI